MRAGFLTIAVVGAHVQAAPASSQLSLIGFPSGSVALTTLTPHTPVLHQDEGPGGGAPHGPHQHGQGGGRRGGPAPLPDEVS